MVLWYHRCDSHAKPVDVSSQSEHHRITFFADKDTLAAFSRHVNMGAVCVSVCVCEEVFEGLCAINEKSGIEAIRVPALLLTSSVSLTCSSPLIPLRVSTHADKHFCFDLIVSFPSGSIEISRKRSLAKGLQITCSVYKTVSSLL